MRYFPRALLAGGLGFASAVLVACGGGSGLLSAGQSSSLNRRLDAVNSAITRGHCTTAAAAAQGFDNAVANLTSVNPTLTNNLKQASSALAQQAGPDCTNRQSSTVVTTPKPTPKPTPKATTPTSTTPTTPAGTSTGTTPTAPATTPTSTGTTPTIPTTGGAGVGGTGTSRSGGGGAPPGNGN